MRQTIIYSLFYIPPLESLRPHALVVAQEVQQL